MHQDQAALDPATASATFAGLLASLTAPKPSGWPAPGGSPDGLEDDVATLSYERALHAHMRYKPQVADPAIGIKQPQCANSATAAPAAAPFNPEPGGKRASVTVRMSRAECAQLRQRAAEAGMTVSAYLRSCTFEAESLRAQVKQALAGLRAAQTAQRPSRRFPWLRFSKRTVSSQP
jgi:hypothetical protein